MENLQNKNEPFAKFPENEGNIAVYGLNFNVLCLLIILLIVISVRLFKSIYACNFFKYINI